jgi:hypothetical protein
MRLPSYPWYPDDWLTSPTRLKMSPESRAIYRDLLDYCFRDGSIPIDDHVLMLMAAVTPAVWRRAWPAVQAELIERDGRYTHGKVEDVRPRVEAWHESRKMNGKLGGRPKASGKPSGYPSANLVPKPSSSSSTTTTIHTPLPPFADDLFEQIWNAYPAKGRTRRPMCEGYYAELMTAANGDAAALHQRILTPLLPGGAWERSKTWGSGYVFALSDYLANRRWQEEPEPKGEWD